MSTESEILRLQETFKTGPVGKRRQAIHKAADLLEGRRCDDYCRRQVILLLEWVVANEPMSTVRDRAQTVLDNVNEGLPPGLHADERQHMIGGECDDGHVHFYSKRDVCTQSSTLVRSAASGPKSKLLVPCREPGCPRKVTLYVDCEPYR